jgi:O-glycosyl hydrolase
VPSGVTYIPQFAGKDDFSQSVPSDATYVLCFNEPNAGDLHGAQGMSVSDAVGLFKQLRAKTQAKIILGNFAVTDTMETWYNEFKSTCSGCQWEAVGIHPYDSQPMTHVERIRKYADGKEIWLTEWNAGSGDHAALIRQTVPTLEKDTQIGGYLWFSENAPISGDIAAAFNEVL